MGLSRRAYAAHRGVSEAAVRKAIASGRITLEADGTINPVIADQQWAASTDPAKQRGPLAQEMGRKAAAQTASMFDRKPVPAAALDAVRDTLEDAGVEAPREADSPGAEISFVKAKLANEVLKAQTAKVRLGKMKGELVDRAKAQAMVFDLARRERDAWIGWPARVAANMAAELKVDPHAMEQVLDRYLREHLAELAEVRIDLR